MNNFNFLIKTAYLHPSSANNIFSALLYPLLTRNNPHERVGRGLEGDVASRFVAKTRGIILQATSRFNQRNSGSTKKSTPTASSVPKVIPPVVAKPGNQAPLLMRSKVGSPQTSNIGRPTRFAGRPKENFFFSNPRQAIRGKGGVSGSATNGGLKIKRVLSLSQILTRIKRQRQKGQKKHQEQERIKPIIPPKSLILILKDKLGKDVYNNRIIDYKHCGLLHRYIGLGGKILPRRQTRLTAKQQRYVAKTIKSARIVGLLPFVNKERDFFR